METKKAIGRPPVYVPEYCERIVEFMSEGKSFTQFAASIRVARQTLLAWGAQYPEFSVARQLASEASEAWWEQQGANGLFSNKEGPNLNSSVYQFIMGRRFRAPLDDEPKKQSEPSLNGDEIKLLIEIYEGLKDSLPSHGAMPTSVLKKGKS